MKVCEQATQLNNDGNTSKYPFLGSGDVLWRFFATGYVEEEQFDNDLANKLVSEGAKGIKINLPWDLRGCLEDCLTSVICSESVLKAIE